MNETKQTKHTPGPWNEDLSRMDLAGVVGPDDVWICRMSRLGDLPSARANAHLIAAAPDLLAACQDVLDLWKDWANNSHFLAEPLKRSMGMRMELIEAAIRKAEGQEEGKD
jgi:hypothetical protein